MNKSLLRVALLSLSLAWVIGASMHTHAAESRRPRPVASSRDHFGLLSQETPVSPSGSRIPPVADDAGRAGRIDRLRAIVLGYAGALQVNSRPHGVVDGLVAGTGPNHRASALPGPRASGDALASEDFLTSPHSAPGQFGRRWGYQVSLNYAPSLVLSVGPPQSAPQPAAATAWELETGAAARPDTGTGARVVDSVSALTSGAGPGSLISAGGATAAVASPLIGEPQPLATQMLIESTTPRSR